MEKGINSMLLNNLFLYYIIFAHFVGDFLFQNDYTALNKSKDNTVLFVHCVMYMAMFIPIFNWIALLIILISHFTIDYITSRLNAYLYGKNQHLFFTSLGFDQMVHMIILVALLQAKLSWIKLQ